MPEDIFYVDVITIIYIAIRIFDKERINLFSSEI